MAQDLTSHSQLPRFWPEFTGRRDLVESGMERLKSSNRHLLTIYGLVGVGKTRSLAKSPRRCGTTSTTVFVGSTFIG